MIPKIIHYCWLSNDPVPENMQKYIDGWKEKLTDYRFIKWDFSRFDKESSLWVSEAFDNKKYAFACDYIRLYALYQYGGIYMDMDIEVLKTFDELLTKKYMMAKERPEQEWIEAGCMGAEKGSPFIRCCLDYYKDKHFINMEGIYEDTPLPRIMAKIYLDNHFDFELYDWQTFTCKSYYTGIIDTKENSFTIHHFAGSWKSLEEQQIHNRALELRAQKWVGSNLCAFVYEKGQKSIIALREGGIKELIIRMRRFMKKE